MRVTEVFFALANVDSKDYHYMFIISEKVRKLSYSKFGVNFNSY